jgi:hypothetical protein
VKAAVLHLPVPAKQQRLWVDRPVAGVDLEMEVTADGAGVAGLADRADSLAGVDAVAAVERRRARQVGVEVAAPLPFAVDRQVVAVEHRVVAGLQDAAAAYGDQRRAAGGDDVEALVDPPAAARRAELADRATGAVRALDREDVVAVEQTTVVDGASGGCRKGEDCEQEEEEGGVLQWCSMTRSTRLYSFASSALMK